MIDSNYFSAVRDRQIIADGGFFCGACLVGKPARDISPDPRYCRGCYEFLLKEAELLPRIKRPAWIPKPTVACPTAENKPAKAIPVPQGSRGVLQHPGGRPLKEGKVHRTTAWRRKKERQGVLV